MQGPYPIRRPDRSAGVNAPRCRAPEPPAGHVASTTRAATHRDSQGAWGPHWPRILRSERCGFPRFIGYALSQRRPGWGRARQSPRSGLRRLSAVGGINFRYIARCSLLMLLRRLGPEPS